MKKGKAAVVDQLSIETLEEGKHTIMRTPKTVGCSEVYYRSKILYYRSPVHITRAKL